MRIKTVFQMVMVCLMIVGDPIPRLITDIVMWIAVALTLVSLVDYLVKNRGVMKDAR